MEELSNQTTEQIPQKSVGIIAGKVNEIIKWVKTLLPDNILAALTGANAPSESNVFITNADITDLTMDKRAVWVYCGRKTFSDFSVDDTSKSIAVYSSGPNVYIHDVKIVPVTDFSGGLISDYQISVGILSNLVKYKPKTNVFTGNTSLVAVSDAKAGMESTITNTDIFATATCVDDNLDQATTGSCDIYVYVSKITLT